MDRPDYERDVSDQYAAAPGTIATCDTAGIIGPIVALMGSIAATEAIKLLVGGGALNDGMIHVDLWDATFDQFEIGAPRPDCPACGQSRFEFLEAAAGARTTSLCGRDAVQVSVAGAAENAGLVRAAARRLALVSMADVGAFFAILLVGFAYVWKRGDLDWVRATRWHDATPENDVQEPVVA